MWSGVVQRYICSYVFFYITTGYVCTNIYISGSKPLFCIYIVAIYSIINCLIVLIVISVLRFEYLNLR